MLCNARIRDSKRVINDNKKSDFRRKDWRVKGRIESSRSPESKLTWSPELSPFSQLTRSTRRVILSPSPKFVPSSPTLDSLTAGFIGCSLQENNSNAANESLQVRDDRGETAATVKVRTSLPATESGARVERRSLKEATPPVHDSRYGGFKDLVEADRVIQTPEDTRALGPVSTHTPLLAHDPPCTDSPLLHYLSPAYSLPLSPREKALALCQQDQPLSISGFFTDKKVKSVDKLGEGTFAEVFGFTTKTGESLAIKIIPIEGSISYNDEPQTTFQDVLTEMVIMKELSLLGEKYSRENMSMAYFTENFIQIKQLALCKGEYPALLLEAWDVYARTRHTENDRPDMFPPEQLYILMAAENAGIALEDYEFSSVKEVLSVVSQVAGALAVGEAALEFEHRDLHMSNVLVTRTTEESFLFRLKGEDFIIQSHGVKATILDYTLSRMKQDDCVSFNDLERLPWLFEGEGDIQFNVYREIKKTTNSHWDQFHPYTNVLWLAYLLAKLTSSVNYSDAVSQRSWRAALRPFTRNIYRFSSAQDIFVNRFSSQN